MHTETGPNISLIDAIHGRQSIRAFRPDPVPRGIMEQIMEIARHSPSWANTQPWQFAIATGGSLARIKEEYEAQYQKTGRRSDLPGPTDLPEPYKTRSGDVPRMTAQARGIPREDAEKRRWWGLQSLLLFGAPVAIYIYTDRELVFQGQPNITNVWPVFDCGMIAENIMLLALRHGLGTIPEIQAVAYPDVLRRVLGIPESKVIVFGLAIGYPDMSDPLNKSRVPKEPVEAFTRWYGFE